MEQVPESPTDLGGRSWWQTLKRSVSEFREDNLADWAAALTYYGVLSLFPALIALVSIAGLVTDPRTLIDALTDFVSRLGPASAVDTFRGPIEQVASDRRTGVVLLIAGLAVALYSASGYVAAFSRASNDIYETAEGRPFYKLRPLQMLLTLALVLLLGVVLMAVVATGPVARAIGEAIGVGDTAVTAWSIAKWPVLVAMVLFMFAVLYYSAPNARLPKFQWVSPGSVVAVVVWIAASALFALYVANFGSYNKTYGALGGVVTFLVWAWITNIAILFGAELNSELERSRELEAGTPGAEHELQLPPREEPDDEKRAGRA
jgi:membrane protein